MLKPNASYLHDRTAWFNAWNKNNFQVNLCSTSRPLSIHMYTHTQSHVRDIQYINVCVFACGRRWSWNAVNWNHHGNLAEETCCAVLCTLVVKCIPCSTCREIHPVTFTGKVSHAWNSLLWHIQVSSPYRKKHLTLGSRGQQNIRGSAKYGTTSELNWLTSGFETFSRSKQSLPFERQESSLKVSSTVWWLSGQEH